MSKDGIIPDGRLHRFRVEGDKAGSRNGWYIFYTEGIPAGAFGSWRTGMTFKWCAKSQASMTTLERKTYLNRMKCAQTSRETESIKKKRSAAERAASIWKAACSAPEDHQYLVKKGIRSHGLRLYNKKLVIPIRDSLGAIHSLQFIDGEGNKRFLSSGRIQGCYYSIGVPGRVLCLCEGYATAASVYEVTGYAAAVAFNCGNLLAVAQTLRQKFPSEKIILCADNDTQTEGNPGLSKAREAAVSIGGFLAIPTDQGDFNDMLKRGAR